MEARKKFQNTKYLEEDGEIPCRMSWNALSRWKWGSGIRRRQRRGGGETNPKTYESDKQGTRN